MADRVCLWWLLVVSSCSSCSASWRKRKVRFCHDFPGLSIAPYSENSRGLLTCGGSAPPFRGLEDAPLTSPLAGTACGCCTDAAHETEMGGHPSLKHFLVWQRWRSVRRTRGTEGKSAFQWEWGSAAGVVPSPWTPRQGLLLTCGLKTVNLCYLWVSYSSDYPNNWLLTSPGT